MSKKIEMTEEELKLYNDVKKEVKKANQRILRLERLTGLKKPFAVKQLNDYIDTFAITEKGRVKVNKTMTETQMKIIQKALKDFIKKSDFSTVKGVKAYKQKLEEEIRDKITFKQANVMYEARRHWDWILDYMTASEFFGYFVWPARDKKWDKEKWIKQLKSALVKKDIKIPDEDLEQDLIDLYNYFIRDYEG